MLLKPTSCEWVHGDREKLREKKIGNRFETKQEKDEKIESQQSNHIGHNPPGFDAGTAKAQQPSSLKQWIKRNPERLANRAVANPASFPVAWNIGIGLITADFGVMPQMVGSKKNRTRKNVGQICNNKGDPVRHLVLEYQIVGAFVDQTVEAMIGECPEGISCQKNDPKWLTSNQNGDHDLNGDD